jgi:hypothetical protein
MNTQNQPFRFELGATVVFTVWAASAEEALGKANDRANELFADHALNFPADADVDLNVAGSPPRLVERAGECCGSGPVSEP